MKKSEPEGIKAKVPGRYRDKLEEVCLFDDDFMTKCFEGRPECVEEVLRIILGNKELKLRKSETQCFIKNLQGKSVRLDICAEDTNDCCYNVEIQRNSDGAQPERARYNGAVLDANNLEPGNEYEKLPETYVIFITENDVRGEGRSVYRIERNDVESNTAFNDRMHIIYVNGQCRDETPVGRLMQDFSCTKADDMYNKVLAERVRYFKETEEGMKKMCKIWDDIREEGREEGLKEGFEKGKLEMLVWMSREEGKPDEYIIEKIEQLFHMDRGQAEGCLREYA